MLAALSTVSPAAATNAASSAPNTAPQYGDGYVIVNPASGISSGDSVFYPTGAIDDSALVIIAEPDGSLPGGLSASQLVAQQKAAKASAPRSGSLQLSASVARPSPVASPDSLGGYFATLSTWSQAYTGGSVIGLDYYATVYYSFDVLVNTSQLNAGEGLGYYRGYLGSQYGVWSQWYSLGTASDGSEGGGSVPWGTVSANAQFRAECVTTVTCQGYFTPGP